MLALNSTYKKIILWEIWLKNTNCNRRSQEILTFKRNFSKSTGSYISHNATKCPLADHNVIFMVTRLSNFPLSSNNGFVHESHRFIHLCVSCVLLLRAIKLCSFTLDLNFMTSRVIINHFTAPCQQTCSLTFHAQSEPFKLYLSQSYLRPSNASLDMS